MLSETITRAPLFSLISFTCDPAFPMIIDASWVTMRQRMWMFAAGGAPPELLGTAVVMAGASGLSPDARSPESEGLPFASGVDAAVSSARDSIFTSPATTEE